MKKENKLKSMTIIVPCVVIVQIGLKPIKNWLEIY